MSEELKGKQPEKPKDLAQKPEPAEKVDYKKMVEALGKNSMYANKQKPEEGKRHEEAGEGTP